MREPTQAEIHNEIDTIWSIVASNMHTIRQSLKSNEIEHENTLAHYSVCNQLVLIPIVARHILLVISA